MSRAYYATFHAITPLSDHLPPGAEYKPDGSHEKYKPKGSHDKKISKLTHCSPTHPEAIMLRAVGNDIQKCKAQRVTADYYIDDPLAKIDAEEQFLKAEYLFEQIAKLKTALQIP